MRASASLTRCFSFGNLVQCSMRRRFSAVSCPLPGQGSDRRGLANRDRCELIWRLWGPDAYPIVLERPLVRPGRRLARGGPFRLRVCAVAREHALGGLQFAELARKF